MYPTEQLIDEHPLIFQRLGYLEISDGWVPLVRDLCDKIQMLCDSDPDVEQVVADQVKQKYRGLCFYYDPVNDKVDGLIKEAEIRSLITCEGCGASPLPEGSRGYGLGVSLCNSCKVNLLQTI